jgi:hypothetical protein
MNGNDINEGCYRIIMYGFSTCSFLLSSDYRPEMEKIMEERVSCFYLYIYILKLDI